MKKLLIRWANYADTHKCPFGRRMHLVGAVGSLALLSLLTVLLVPAFIVLMIVFGALAGLREAVEDVPRTCVYTFKQGVGNWRSYLRGAQRIWRAAK